MATTEATKRKVLLVSTDKEFCKATQGALGASEGAELSVIESPLADVWGEVVDRRADAIVVDLDERLMESLEALQRVKRMLGGQAPIVVVVKEYDAAIVRVLVQLQIADFLVKPVKTNELVRAVARALSGPEKQENDEAEIYAFMPATGGVGNTVLAIQTAFLLHGSAKRAPSTCIVDMNFQLGSVAEYLDLEPRFQISEVEHEVDRLDRQLLDVLLSKHKSGISVLAAPNIASEQRTFNADIVVRILDLVSAYFDNVIIDMPRIWFPWTETVLRGANHVYVTSELTVPCMRHTQRLINGIRTETAETVKPNVIINRMTKYGTRTGIREEDVVNVLGDAYAGSVSNNYNLVCTAIDQGVPLHDVDAEANVISDLRRIILPEEANLQQPSQKKRGFFTLPKPFMKKAG